MSTAAATEKKPAEDTKETAAVAPKAGKGKLLLIIGLVLVLAGGGGGFWFWQSRQAAPAKAAAEPKPIVPLQFHALEPAFVVNFQGGQGAKFLQIEVRIASREAETIELLKTNDPLIRNDLLMLFGSQQQDQLGTVEGKEKLRADTLAAVRRVIAREGGKAESVESVLFTSFVMQ
jgi:flagellar FliL protein